MGRCFERAELAGWLAGVLDLRGVDRYLLSPAVQSPRRLKGLVVGWGSPYNPGPVAGLPSFRKPPAASSSMLSTHVCLWMGL